MRLHLDEKLHLDERGFILLKSTLTSPKTVIKKPNTNNVDYKFEDSSIRRNTTHVDFNDKNLDNVRFVKVNSMPAVGELLTTKDYVDNAIYYSVEELSLLRLDPDEQLKLDEKASIILNSTLTSTKTIMELPIKPYVDSLHESSINRPDLSSVFSDQDNEFDNNKLTNLDTVTFNKKPTSENELSTNKYIDDELDKNTIQKFNQTLENYLKVSVGNDTYNPTKYDRIQITNTTKIKYPNTGDYLLQNWVIKCNDKTKNGNIQNFIKSTKTNSPTCISGATTLAPIGTSFMYIETSSDNHGNIVFVSFERTNIIQVTNITFYFNRF